jgi:hypothetical protein
VHGCIQPSNTRPALLNTEGHFSTRGGVRDCSSYLITTVYPTAQTFTRYSNQTFTSTVTTSITDTLIERTGQVFPPDFTYASLRVILTRTNR